MVRRKRKHYDCMKKEEKIYEGNVFVDSSNLESWLEKLEEVTKITGDLFVYSNCDFKAEKLKSIGGGL